MGNYAAVLLIILGLNLSPCVTQVNNVMQSEMKQSDSIEMVANGLTEAGYSGLFLRGDRSLSSSIWQNGENRLDLEQIVQSSDYPDLTRLLASEVLYEKVPSYPLTEWQGTLAYIYSQALAITGVETGGLQLTGNQWGLMYYTDQTEIKDYGILGTRLVATGTAAIPYLTELLNNAEIIFYEGSEEATVGNDLGYRVKDAAAYYIGQISGIPVRFYQETTDRDAEIERLREVLEDNHGQE